MAFNQSSPVSNLGKTPVFVGDAAGGDLTGIYPNPQLAPGSVTQNIIAIGAVGNAQLQDGSITPSKIFNINTLFQINFPSQIFSGVIISQNISPNAAIQTSQLADGPNFVLTYGNQAISGNKLFLNSSAFPPLVGPNIATKDYVDHAVMSGTAGVGGPNSVGFIQLQLPSVSGNIISSDTVNFLKIPVIQANSIFTAALQVGSISGNVIASRSILNGDLALASISGSVISSDTVTFLKIPNPNTVGTTQLQVGSVSGNVIGVGAILNGDLALASISGNVISSDTYTFLRSNPLPNTINTAALQVGSISGNVIATRSILNGDLALASVSGNVIAPDTYTFLTSTQLPNTIGTAALQVGSISGNVIGIGAILNGDIANASISGNLLSSDTVNFLKTPFIQPNSIYAAALQVGSVSGNAIAMNAIGPNQLGYASVLSGNVAPNSIGYAAMQLPSVSGNTISSDTISFLRSNPLPNTIPTSALQVGSISGSVIGIGAILSDDIANNSISYIKMQQPSVSGNIIAANSILTGHLSPNSISTSNLQIGSVSGNAISTPAISIGHIAPNTLNFGHHQFPSVSGNIISSDTISFLRSNPLPNSIPTSALQVGSISGNVIATPGLSQGNVLSGYVDLNTNQSVSGVKLFNNLPQSYLSPVNAIDLVNKNYVDSVAVGLASSDARLATTGALAANNYLNGIGGIGATLTATGNGALSVDSTVVVVNDRLLIKNEGTPANNGIYTVTSTGSAITPYILTRALDMNDSTEFNGVLIFIQSGTTNIGSAWVCTAVQPVTVGITNITFASFTLTPSGAAGGSLTGTYPNPSIASNTIGTSQLQVGSVSGNVIGIGAILSDDIGPNSISYAKMQQPSVSGNIISSDTISFLRSNPLPNTIGTNALQVGSVSGNAISADTITFLKGSASGKSIKETITQTAHGFAVGNVIYYQNNTNGWQKSQANSTSTAEGLGIVDSIIDANNFSVTYNGRITGLSGINPGGMYWIDPNVAGNLTSIEPIFVGQISRPILEGVSPTDGVIKDYRGILINSGVGTVFGTLNYGLGSVSGNAISSDTVTFLKTPNIQPNSIYTAAMQLPSVSGNIISTSSILNGHLASASISGSVVSSDTVNFFKIPNPNTVGTAQLQSGSISGNVISADAVNFLTSTQLPNTIPNIALQSASISGNVIANQSIQANQIFPTVLSQSKNTIHNSNMNIWQRISGSGFTGITTQSYGPDRFSLTNNGNTVVKMERDFGIIPAGSACSAKISVTTPSSISGSNDVTFGQGVEGYDFIKIYNQTCTLSFWVYTNRTGTYNIALCSNGSSIISYVSNFTVNTVNTWQKISITFTTNGTAVSAWKFDSNLSLSVYIVLAAGPSLWVPTANTWITGFFVGTSSGNNGFTVGNGNYFNVAQMQLELGDTATSFEYVPFQQQMATCQRYYQKSYPLANYPGQPSIAAGFHVTANMNSVAVINQANYGWTTYQVPMRIAAAVTTYGYATGTTGTSADETGLENTANTSAVANQNTDRGFTAFNNTGGSLTHVAFGIIFHWAANADFAV